MLIPRDGKHKTTGNKKYPKWPREDTCAEFEGLCREFAGCWRFANIFSQPLPPCGEFLHLSISLGLCMSCTFYRGVTFRICTLHVGMMVQKIATCWYLLCWIWAPSSIRFAREMAHEGQPQSVGMSSYCQESKFHLDGNHSKWRWCTSLHAWRDVYTMSVNECCNYLSLLQFVYLKRFGHTLANGKV